MAEQFEYRYGDERFVKVINADRVQFFKNDRELTLDEWNREINRHQSMSVKETHRNPVIRLIERFRRRTLLALARPRRDDVIADIGCESGFIAEAFVGRCKQLYLIDIDPTLIEKARARLAEPSGNGGATPKRSLSVSSDSVTTADTATCQPATRSNKFERGTRQLPQSSSRARFVQSDATHINLPNRVADITLLSEILEHVPDERAVLREACRITKPGGRVIVSVPNDRLILWIKRILGQLLRRRFLRGLSDGLAIGHLRLYTKHSLKHLCSEFGTVQAAYYAPPFFLNIHLAFTPKR